MSELEKNSQLIDHFSIIAEQISAYSAGIDEILEQIVKSASQVLDADPVLLFRYDKDESKLVTPKIYASDLFEDANYINTFASIGDTFAEKVVKDGKSLYFEKIEELDQPPFMSSGNVNIAEKPLVMFHSRETVKSMAALVLKAGEETVGLMILIYRNQQKYTDSMKKLMKTFASYATIAIRNSQFIQQLRKREGIQHSLMKRKRGVKESRHLKIEDIIVRLDNIRKVVQILKDKFSKNESVAIYCVIRYADNSSFESEEVSLFFNDAILNTQRVSSLEITFQSEEEQSYIHIEITHGPSNLNNSITVRGINSEWVNDTATKLQNAVNIFEPQNKIYKKYKLWFHIPFSISIGLALVWIASLIFSETTQATGGLIKQLLGLAKTLTQTNSIYKYVVSYFLGSIPAVALAYKLSTSLWPSIEIQIGPKHTFVEEKRRKMLWGIFLLGVLPLLSSLVYDLFISKLF